MKNLVYLLFLALLAFAVVGYFLDWYHLEKQPAANGKQRISLDIDPGKIKSDLQKGESKVQDAIEKVKQ